MSSRLTIAALGVLAGLMSQAGWCAQPSAGAAAQAALNQCVSMHTTGADRILTARWLFVMMAASPQISDLSAVTAERKKDLDQGFARLFTRLVTKDCAGEVRPLAAANLQDAFEEVGKALGETAMNELVHGKEVDKAMGAYTDFISEDDFKAFMESLPKKSK
jgi:hypothetical protein